MKTLLAWIAAARWRKSLSHCLEGLIVFVPVGLGTHNVWFAALAVVVWYYSRKVTETQLDAKAREAQTTTVAVWDVGWFPWDWWHFDPYRVLDVVLPGLSSFALAGMLASHPWM